MRLSLASLLIATAVFGLLLAGIAWPTQFWAEIVFSSTLLCLTAAGLAAIAPPSSRRSFWLGFSLVGFAYLILALYFGDQSRPRLITHRALIELDDLAKFSTPRQLLDGTRSNWTSDGTIEVFHSHGAVEYMLPKDASRLGYLQLAYPSPGAVPSSKNYYTNGHLAWTWALATAAGAFLAWLHRPRRNHLSDESRSSSAAGQA